jgi:hypothetical protein
MPTPSPPSKILNLQQDSPLAQDASYEFGDEDRAYIDSQALGAQGFLLQCLLLGIHATFYTLDAGSAAAAIGDVVCSASTGSQTVTRALTAPLAIAGSPAGIVLLGAPPGGRVLVAMAGLIPATITGINGTGSNQVAVVNASTARALAQASLSTGNVPLGSVDGAGNLELLAGVAPVSSSGGSGPSVSGSGLWNNIAGVLQAAALIGTAGQFAVTNTALEAAFVSLSGDVTASTTIPGKVTVTGLQGVALPVPTGTNTTINFNAGAFSWVAGGTTVSVTGTGLWHNVAGSLQAAALIGTAGQFYVVNATPDAACVALSGDVSASATTIGKLTVTGIQNVPISAPTVTSTVPVYNGTSIVWATVGGGGTFSPGADIFGNATSTAIAQYVSSLSYSSSTSGGPIAVNGTNTLLNWVTNAISLQQAGTLLLSLKSAGTDFVRFGASPGSVGFIRAPTNSVVVGVNGTSILQTDGGPATYLNGTGALFLQVGSASQATLTTSALSLVPASILFTAIGGSTTTIGFTSPGTAGGAVFVIRAQSATGANVGGSLTLQSGAGSSGDGNLNFTNGNTTTMVLTETSLGLLPPNLLFTATTGSTTTIGFNSPATAGGGVLLIRAQFATGANVGGSLTLQSGHGTSGDGNLNFANGNTTTMVLTEASLQLLPVNFLFSATAGAATTIGFSGQSAFGHGAILQIIGQSASTSGNGGGILIAGGVHAGSGPIDGQVQIAAGTTLCGTFTTTGFTLDIPLGGDASQSLPFQFAADQTSANISLTGTSFALSPSQYANVVLTLFGSLTANVTLTVPNVAGSFWVVDIRFLTFNGFTVTFAASGGGNNVSFGAPFSGASTGFVIYIARVNSMGLVG